MSQNNTGFYETATATERDDTTRAFASKTDGNFEISLKVTAT